ncbi:MAG TPA: phage repressor protein [Clostridiales bacterium]|nr:phage repressor protein [Clostridiales bacterium]
MYGIDFNKLNVKIQECGTTKEAIADEIGIDRNTFCRRLSNGKPLIGDIHKICDLLHLSSQEAIEIFLIEFDRL